jgi:hypothetical protein
MSAERVDVLAVMGEASELLEREGFSAIPNDLLAGRAAVAELIEASKKARDGYRSTLRLMGCDEFFIDAQTAELDTILSSIQGKP